MLITGRSDKMNSYWSILNQGVLENRLGDLTFQVEIKLQGSDRVAMTQDA